MTELRPSWTVAELLTLEQTDAMRFRATTSMGGEASRIYGGQVAAQSLMAAGSTVDLERQVHSAHAYFLRSGDPTAPLDFEVQAVRDGRSFSARVVAAVQGDVEIFRMMASFQQPSPGVAHQVPHVSPPAPEQVPTLDEVYAPGHSAREWYEMFRSRFPMDVRFVGEPPRTATKRGEAGEPVTEVWMRSSNPLPDEPLWQACGLIFMSDMFLLASNLPPHGPTFGDRDVLIASLDHTVWFHGPVRSDDWLFYDERGLWAEQGRGLSQGHYFTREGDLVATVMQEGVIRLPRER